MVLTFLIGKQSNKEGVWKVSGPQIVFPIDASERGRYRWAFQLRCCLLVHLFFWAKGQDCLFWRSLHSVFCACLLLFLYLVLEGTLVLLCWVTPALQERFRPPPVSATRSSFCLPRGWAVWVGCAVVRTVTCPWLAALGPVLRHTWSDSGDILPEGLGLVKINCLEH